MKEIKLCHVCGSKTVEKEAGTILCMECGFHTHPNFKQEYRDKLEATMPKLIKALRFNDKRTGLIWYPIVVNIPNVGILFPDGNSVENWKWSFAKIVPIPLHERMKYPIPNKTGQFYETRLDIENAIIYPKYEFQKIYKEFLEYVKTR
jgi:hypothetical protein